jgi:hypothetical protein
VRRVDHSYDVAIEYSCGLNRIRDRSSLGRELKSLLIHGTFQDCGEKGARGLSTSLA